MRLTVDKYSSLQRIFTSKQLEDEVLDASELAAAGVDDAMLGDLGLKASAKVTASLSDRLLGAVLQRNLGQKPAASRDERRLDADIVAAYAAYSNLTATDLSALLSPILALPLERKRRAVPVLSGAFGDDYYRSVWIRDPAKAKEVGAFVAALTKIDGFKPAGAAFFTEIPTDPVASVELLQTLIARFGYAQDRLWTSGRVLRLLVQQGVTAPKAQRDAILFLDRHVSRDANVLSMLHDQKVGFAALNEKTLASEIINALPGLAPAAAANLINEMHDLQGANGGGDSHRKAIIAGLPDKTTLNLLAEATDELYNSTYLLMLANVRSKNADVGAWIRDQSPTKEQLAGVCNTLSRFRQTDVIAQAGDLFADALADGLSASYYGWGASPARYIPLALAVLRTGSVAAKTKLEASLIAKCVAKDGSHAYAAMVLRTAFDEGLTKSPVAAALPARPTLEAPVGEWLADGAVTSVLFCYTESGGSDPGGIAAFYEKSGFGEVVGRAAPFGLNKKQTRVFEKTVAGVIQRIVITTDATRDRDEVIRDKGVDIVVHRGHSYQLYKTFPANVTSDPEGKRKLLFGGSCSSFGSMTSSGFQAAYGEHLILSDADTG